MDDQLANGAVSVIVNGVHAHCSNYDVQGNCAVRISEAATPIIDAVAPSSAAAGDSITVSGSGFLLDGEMASDVRAALGPFRCDVTAVSNSSVTCTLTSGAADSDLVVAGQGAGAGVGIICGNRGAAGVASGTSLGFALQSEATSSTSTASLAGGSLVTVSGRGLRGGVLPGSNSPAGVTARL